MLGCVGEASAAVYESVLVRTTVATTVCGAGASVTV